MAEVGQIGDGRMILHLEVIVLADNNHSLGGDCPLQPSLSRQGA